MYSKAKVGGHPLHPTSDNGGVPGRLLSRCPRRVRRLCGERPPVLAEPGDRLSVVGAGSAVLAALPGFVDLAFGLP